MEKLLASYSLGEIVLFIFLVAVAGKELISIVDWFRDRLKKLYDKDYHEKEEHEKLENKIEDLNKFYQEKKIVDDGFAVIHKAIAAINERIDMLIESDKEDIKTKITESHHYFVYEKGWIDDYSMDCLEKRFAIYEREHGNSFVRGLMDELRALPKRPPTEIEHKYIGTAEYIKRANG